MKYVLSQILTTAAKKFGADDYIYEKIDGKFTPHNFQQFTNDVWQAAANLQQAHQSDDIIVICAENSYNYMVADAAIMSYVGISAVLNKEWNTYDLINALDLLQPKTFFYGASKTDIIPELQAKFPNINFLPLADLLTQQSSGLQLDEQRINHERPCKIVFTSGTTSMPKAVMLSQRNIFSCYDDLVRRAPMTHHDKDYLFLPLSHTYAGIWNFLISLINGMQIYLCRDTQEIFADLATVQPTIFCAVPLIYERLYAVCRQTQQNPAELLGGKIKYLFCGGAYFKPEIREFLKAHGLNLLEAYGLTETSSMISVEYSNDNDFISSGTLMESLTAKVDQPNQEGIGEILIKGDNIFQEYYKNPEATKLAKTDDGFFRTGDLGKIVDRKIYLQGRKKRVILFANGENVYPEDIEKLFTDDNITKVKVFQKDQQIFAQIFVKEMADGQKYIDEVNAKLPKFSRIRDFEVVTDSINTRLK